MKKNMTENQLPKEIPEQIKKMELRKKIPKKIGGRWFTSHEEIKTRQDLQDLLNSFSVQEKLTQMLSKIDEMTNLATSIQKDIQEFEKGGELDKEKLGKDIARLRLLKHQLRIIVFGKFQELLTGEVNDFAKQKRKKQRNKHGK